MVTKVIETIIEISLRITRILDQTSIRITVQHNWQSNNNYNSPGQINNFKDKNASIQDKPAINLCNYCKKGGHNVNYCRHLQNRNKRFGGNVFTAADNNGQTCGSVMPDNSGNQLSPGQQGSLNANFEERGHEVVDYIPGLAPTTIADMPTIFHGTGSITYPRVLESMLALKKAQYALFSSIYEFEGPVLDCLKDKLGIPVYHIGPMIPYFDLKPNTMIYKSDYFQWLDSQPKHSVLYISQGSFLSLSTAQRNEFVEGIKESGVRFLWVTRDVSSQFKDGIGDMGFLVPWCDQLKVLCHPSVGGFWTHCGWNSTCEGIYAGVPMVTCPIFWDQVPNSKVIVNDMKIGLRAMKNTVNPEKVLTSQQVAGLVKKFMDPRSDERREMVERAKMLSNTFRRAVAKGGSAASDLESFINSI